MLQTLVSEEACGHEVRHLALYCKSFLPQLLHLVANSLFWDWLFNPVNLVLNYICGVWHLQSHQYGVSFWIPKLSSLWLIFPMAGMELWTMQKFLDYFICQLSTQWSKSFGVQASRTVHQAQAARMVGLYPSSRTFKWLQPRLTHIFAPTSGRFNLGPSQNLCKRLVPLMQCALKPFQPFLD